MMCRASFVSWLVVLVTCLTNSGDALISLGHHSNETENVIPTGAAKPASQDADPLSATVLEDNTLLDTAAPVLGNMAAGPDANGTLIPSFNASMLPSVDDHSQTYDKLYEKGVKHYLDNEWHQCVGYFQLAIDDYHWYHNALVGCRRSCKVEADAATLLTAPLDNTQTFYEITIRNALCLLKCRRTNFSARKNHVATTAVDRDFEISKPYDYLQLCLFKIGRYQEAASAAVTVLAHQPDHTVMTANLRQYIDNFSAEPELLENLELKDYAKEYVLGDRAHTEEDYENSVKHMETALEFYWTALGDCRVMCEEPFDQGWFPDFVSSVANHYTFTFRCKRRCPEKLSNLYGQEIPNFLPSIFNYLQFGYQKLEKIPVACGAVESYLELVPTDAAMLRNKQFYQTEYQKMSRYFTPRKDVIAHAARERYEADLLHFIDTEFVFLEDVKEELQPPQPSSADAPSIRETLADMLATVFAGKPSLIDDQKGEL